MFTEQRYEEEIFGAPACVGSESLGRLTIMK